MFFIGKTAPHTPPFTQTPVLNARTMCGKLLLTFHRDVHLKLQLTMRLKMQRLYRRYKTNKNVLPMYVTRFVKTVRNKI